MSSTETDSSNEVELNGLGDTDPGLIVDLDVAAWAGSNPNKRKEPEPASPSISSNGDALLVSDVKVGDKLLAKGHAPNGERAWFHAEVIGRRVPSQSALVKYTHTVEGSDDPRALPFPRTALVLEVDTLLAREWEAKRKATREPNLGELTGSSAGGSAGSSASHPIPSHPDPSHPAPSHPIPSHPAPSHPAPSHPAPSHPAAGAPPPSLRVGAEAQQARLAFATYTVEVRVAAKRAAAAAKRAAATRGPSYTQSSLSFGSKAMQVGAAVVSSIDRE